MESQNDRLLNQLAQTLKEELGSDLKHLFLFGSRARGDHSTDSDYDCLLVVNEVSPGVLETIDRVAGEFLFTHEALFSIIPMSETRYHTEKHHPLLKNVAQEGVAL